MSLERHVRRVRSRPAPPAHVVADALRRQARDRGVEHLHVHRHPSAVIGQACRRHHAVVADGCARIVELQQEAGLDDHPVFGAHGLADGDQALLIAVVKLVLAVGNDAGGRRHGQERLFDLHVSQRSFEVVDVALQSRLAGIGDRPDANRSLSWWQALRAHRAQHRTRRTFADRPPARKDWHLLDRPPLEAAEPFENVLRPADGLSELAVADDVDAGIGLPANDLGNGFAQAFVIGLLVERVAGLLRAQELLQSCGRIRLPTWVVRMRSVLRFILFHRVRG